MKESGRAGCVANLALLLALAALLLGWAAYRRGGGEVGMLWGSLWGTSPETPRQEGEREAARLGAMTRARARLLARRSEVAANHDLSRVGDEVARARRELERAFDGAGQEARSRWRQLDAELGRLQVRLHDGGAAALAAFDRALDRLRGGEGTAEERGRRAGGG
jgi:hypothetical protein